MIEACERRILEFPVSMDARECRQGAQTRGLVCLRATSPEGLILQLSACGQKGGQRGRE